MKKYCFCSDKTALFLKTTDILFPEVPKDNILFFDIETTSFEAANGCIFLIGVMYFDKDRLIGHHYFSESISEELDMIRCFIDLCDKYTVFLSYKGDSFDIPFIGKRLYALGEKELYARLQVIRSRSYDLFNDIHSFKPYLKFTSTKLNSLRTKFGQITADRISGENICRFYIEHLSATKLKALMEISMRPENTGFIPDYNPRAIPDELAHIKPDSGDRFLDNVLSGNRDNMEAILYLMRLAHIIVMRTGKFTVEISNQRQNTKDLTLSSHADTQECISEDIVFKVQERDLVLDVALPVLSMELKQFYPNYKDYFYFPDEDMAVHKSLAAFTDSVAKKKATIKTAYRKVRGRFVNIPKSFARSESNKTLPQYKSCFESEEYFLPYEEFFRLNSEKAKELAYYCILERASEDLNLVLI